MGNTSADMDSVVGSLALSWYYGETTKNAYSPVINCLRNELRYRIEIIEHLNKFGLDEAFLKENVIFADDLKLPDEGFKSIESIALVDFNQLPKEFESHLASKVHYIVDHHIDMNLYKDSLVEKEIKLIGSASTLVINKLLASEDKFFAKDDASNSDLALFLSAPISLDSYNFEPNLYKSKWTDEDKSTFAKLQEFNTDLKQNANFYSQTLLASKQDVKKNLELGCKENLIKDFKVYDLIEDDDLNRYGIGVSSIVITINTFLEYFTTNTVIYEMQQLMKDKNLGLFMVVTNYKSEDGGYKKEVMLFSDNQILDEDISKFQELKDVLETDKSYKLNGMVDNHTNQIGLNLVTWNVGNLKMTRKNLEKLIKEFYNYKIYSDFLQDGFGENMEWFNAPNKWQVPFDAACEVEGYGGGWEIFEDGKRLQLRPPSKKDFWRKTYYKPSFIKDDGPCYFRTVPSDMELTMEVYLSLRPFR